MSKRNPIRNFCGIREVILPVMMLYICFPLALCIAENLLHQRGIESSHETGRIVDYVFASGFRSGNPATA